MIQIVEERSEGQQSQQYTFDDVQQRIQEEVTISLRLEIQVNKTKYCKLSSQNFSCGKICNGIPKKYLQKLKQMKMGKSNRQCSICCNQFQKDELILQLPCKHIYHTCCVYSWLQSSTKCPNCRSDVLEALKCQTK